QGVDAAKEKPLQLPAAAEAIIAPLNPVSLARLGAMAMTGSPSLLGGLMNTSAESNDSRLQPA
ncbi:MAG TPA: hypothetical protein VK689_12510, partial [Armatimonadota bacterium]|nr:hypothetical protein [Armatimonadota bacterium]